jgi:hypothetical protein
MCGGGKSDKYKGADYSDPNYTGPGTDPKLKDGPIGKRKCTDVICCIIFIVFVVFAV